MGNQADYVVAMVIGLNLPMRKIDLKADSTGGIALSKTPRARAKRSTSTCSTVLLES